MPDFNKKIKDARLLLGKTQGQVASESGLLQKEISKIESGVRKFIPNQYIEYLYQQNIDLNSIFDQLREVSFRDMNSDIPVNWDKIIELSTKLGQQTNENKHLNEDNIKLRLEIEKLKKELGKKSPVYKLPNVAEP